MEEPDLAETIALATLLNVRKLPRRTKVAQTYDEYGFFAKAIVEHLERSGWRFEKRERPASDFMPPTPG